MVNSAVSLPARLRRWITSSDALAGLLISFLCFAASCDQSDEAIDKKKLTVLATVYPLAELAREVGGDEVQVDWLIESGKPLAMISLSRRERDRMESTDYTLCDSQHRTEVWAADDLDRRQNSGHLIAAESAPAASGIRTPGILSLDPLVMQQFAAELADRFAVDLSSSSNDFHRRADALAGAIQKVAAAYPKESFGGGNVATFETTYGPLLKRFGIQSFMIDRDVYRLTDADLEAVKIAAAKGGAAALLVPFDLPPGAVNRIEDRTGLKVFAIDALGLPGLKGHNAYVDLLKYNLDQLEQATVVRR